MNGETTACTAHNATWDKWWLRKSHYLPLHNAKSTLPTVKILINQNPCNIISEGPCMIWQHNMTADDQYAWHINMSILSATLRSTFHLQKGGTWVHCCSFICVKSIKWNLEIIKGFPAILCSYTRSISETLPGHQAPVIWYFCQSSVKLNYKLMLQT